MNYENFFFKILVPYEVELVGWPEDIPFKNLSKLIQIEVRRIHTLLNATPPALYFRRLTKAELKVKLEERDRLEKEGVVPEYAGNKKKYKRKLAQARQEPVDTAAHTSTASTDATAAASPSSDTAATIAAPSPS